MVEYFADSFAFFARAEGNPRYIRIMERAKIVTSALNVLEVYTVMLNRLPREDALRYARACFQHAVDVPNDVAFDASEFKRKMLANRKNCSSVDAWGYAAARRLGYPFLTGDRPFKGVPGVEFVR